MTSFEKFWTIKFFAVILVELKSHFSEHTRMALDQCLSAMDVHVFAFGSIFSH